MTAAGSEASGTVGDAGGPRGQCLDDPCSVAYASTVRKLASALEASLAPDPDRVVSGRALAASLTWDDAARQHLEFYARHPHPAGRIDTRE